MSTTGPGGMGLSAEGRPHAYDPLTHPELFDGVLARRMIAFVIDIVVISIPVIFAALFILIFGLITLGLGWILFWLWWPAAVIWALVYYGITLGSPQSATIGMRVMNIQMRTWYGAPSYFLLGVAHAILFWLTVSLLTPFILLVGFFNTRRRLLHDMLIGTVVINHPSGISPTYDVGP
ncbi:MAG TPA: RDD family protein [Xanthobacteraceae bacterium]|nr:RDD family protein [Xanthobacteraceae bacterium]